MLLKKERIYLHENDVNGLKYEMSGKKIGEYLQNWLLGLHWGLTSGDAPSYSAMTGNLNIILH